jgi:hypothetical protein
MRLAVWTTGHSICDTVAQSFIKAGCDNYHVSQIDKVDMEAYDAHIAYGILRGTDGIFKRAKHWFNVDLGYLDAGHYDGTYRISYRGTQARWTGAKAANHSLRDIVLIAPPTPPVCEFFKVDAATWLSNAIQQCKGLPYHVRYKTDKPLDWTGIGGVITFNSSLGWQALRRGLGVISDVKHSLVGSYLDVVDSLATDTKSIDRNNIDALLMFMRANQFRLAEIERGAAWCLVKSHIISSSDLIAGKQSPPMSLVTAFANAAPTH